MVKNFLIIIISGALILFLFFKIPPSAFYIVFLFLVLIFVLVSNLVSLLWFLIWYKNDVRVWYLKEDAYESIFKKSTFLSLSIVLSLLLKYLGQLNGITFVVLIFVLIGYYLLSEKMEN